MRKEPPTFCPTGSLSGGGPASLSRIRVRGPGLLMLWGRIEGLTHQMQKRRRVLAYGVGQDRLGAFSRHLTKDVDGLSLKSLQVAEAVEHLVR